MFGLVAGHRTECKLYTNLVLSCCLIFNVGDPIFLRLGEQRGRFACGLQLVAQRERQPGWIKPQQLINTSLQSAQRRLALLGRLVGNLPLRPRPARLLWLTGRGQRLGRRAKPLGVAGQVLLFQPVNQLPQPFYGKLFGQHLFSRFGQTVGFVDHDGLVVPQQRSPSVLPVESVGQQVIVVADLDGYVRAVRFSQIPLVTATAARGAEPRALLKHADLPPVKSR